MSAKAPPWLPHAQEDPERARFAEMTPEERLAIFVEVCEVGRAFLESRPDRREILRWQEPMPAHAERSWRELVRRARGA